MSIHFENEEERKFWVKLFIEEIRSLNFKLSRQAGDNADEHLKEFRKRNLIISNNQFKENERKDF